MRLKRVAGIGFGTFLGLYIFLTGIFFVFHPTRGAALPLSLFILFPAANVKGVPIYYHQVAVFSNELLSEGVFSTHEDAFQAALSKSVANAGVRSLAQDLHVDVEETLSSAQGETDFEREYVNGPLLLAQKTEDAVLHDAVFQAEPQKRLSILRERFIDGTLPFVDAAPRFSEDVSGGNNGDLGVFYLHAIPDWLLPAKDLTHGQVSEALEGPDAYWLIEVSERGGDVETGEWVRFRGIAAKKETLKSVLDERMKENPPWVFIW